MTTTWLQTDQASPHVTVANLVTQAPVTLPPTATLAEAARTMVEHKMGSVVVLDDASAPIGILTERDLLRVMAEDGDPHARTVSDEMTSPVVSADVSWEVYEAAAEMTDRHIRHLVVVEDGRAVGVLSIRDLLLAGQRVELADGHWAVLRDPLTLTIRERRRLQRQLLTLDPGPTDDVDVDDLVVMLIGSWSCAPELPTTTDALDGLDDDSLTRLREAVREDLPTLLRTVHPAPGWRDWRG